MIPVLTADEMRRADRHAIDEVGLPGPVLMENAGAAVARLVDERFPGARRVIVVCGRGNNGGDGFVVARRLGARAEALLLGGREGVEGDARVHLLACERSSGRVTAAGDPAGTASVASAATTIAPPPQRRDKITDKNARGTGRQD